MTMSFDQFRATGVDCADLGVALSDECLMGSVGRLYVDALHIQHWTDDRDGIAPPHGPTWLLTLGNEQPTGDLLTLEARLYVWAVDNGYCDDETAAAPVRTYATEFPDFEGTIPAVLTGKGWSDTSWHNDAMPFFVHQPSGVGVWCNYPTSDLPESSLFTAVAMSHGGAADGWQYGTGGEVDLFEADDAETLAASLPNFTNMRAIAHLFALAFETDYADNLAEIRARNASDDYAAPVCATHDFCDANMVMLEAFETVMGRSIRYANDTPDGDAASQADFELMGAAWNIARKERLTGQASAADPVEVAPAAAKDDATPLERIAARIRGEWFDPHGDLESDIAGVLREAGVM